MEANERQYTNRGYLVALVATATVVVLRYAFNGILGHEAPFLFFILAILSAAWCDGLKPGLLATALSLLCGTYFFVDRTGFLIHHRDDYVRMVMLLVVGGLTSWLCENVHQNRRRWRSQQQALRASNDRLLTFINNAPVAIAMFDHEMRYVAVSRRWLTSYGLVGRDLIGQSHYNIFSDIPERWRVAHQRGLAGESFRGEEDRWDRADGSTQWTRWGLQPWYSEDGKIGGIIISVEDFTQRKHAETELRKSNRLLQTISRVQAKFLVQGDTQEVFGQMLAAVLEVSESEYGFIGEVLQTPAGQPYLKTHTITNIAWDEPTRHFYDKHSRTGLEFTNLNTLFGAVLTTRAPVIANDPPNDPRQGGLPAGHPPLRAFMGLPIRQGGCMVGVVGIANRSGGYDESIAEQLAPLLLTCGSLIEAVRIERSRQSAVDQVQASQHMLKTVLNTIPQGVFWKDHESRYLGCNAVVSWACGLQSPEQVVGKTDRDLPSLTPEQADFFIQKDREVMASGQPIMGILEQVTLASGPTIWIETNKIPLRDAHGRIEGVLGTFTDITERRKLEEQLRQSQKMEAIGQLAGGVAHDFNNLLTIIIGYSDVLLTRLPVDSSMRQELRLIRGAGERGASLTRQLLAFSRKQVLQPKILDLNAIVADSEKMLRRVIGEHIDFSVRYDPDLGSVKADPSQIGQILLNLAVNARDAMPEGGVLRIETSTTELNESDVSILADVKVGRYASLTVRDTGCGMTTDVLAHIFEPFFTTKEQGKGTGLGLAVVHGIVKQSDGHIEVQSQPDVGTTFKVHFPIVDESLAAVSQKETHFAAKPCVETVLLVEDEEGVRKLSQIALQNRGYKVLTAMDGNEAIEIAESYQGRINVLVSDVVMPGMSGPQLAATLKSRFPAMKVMFVSGYTQDDVLRHGVSVGETAFLQKPFGPVALADLLRKVLDSN